jgi:hypothetical protein
MDLANMILSAVDSERDTVPCPEWANAEWDGTVTVQGLTGTQRDAFEASCRQVMPSHGGKQPEVVARLENVRAKLLVKCIIDPETGNRVFTEQQINALGEKSGKVLDRLFEKASELSGLSEEDVEDLAKNSEAGPTGSSPSDSLESWDAPSLSS